MWPHKRGLGPRLGYGVDGPGYVLVVPPGSSNSPSHSVNLEFNCARLQNNPQAFIPATTPTRLGPKSSRTNELMPDSSAKLSKTALEVNESVSSFIPPEVCKPLLVESSALDSELVIDPSQGALFAASYGAERNIYPRRLDYMAYVGGTHQSVLYVSYMGRQYLPDGPHHDLFNDDEDVEAKEILGIFDFKDAIKQIFFMPIEPAVLRCLIVRTSFKIVVLFIKSESDSRQVVIPVKTIVAADYFHYELADVAFDLNNEAYFAAIDVEGNIRMWKVLGEPVIVVAAPRVALILPTYEPVSISRWRRLVWIGDHMIVFSRNRVVLHSNKRVKPGVASFFTYDTKTILSAEVWVHLQDVQVHNDQMFVLTSKELMWCRLNNGKFERMLSWKHSLSDQDTTLRLDLTFLPRSQEYICLLRSLIRPLALVITFGYQNGRQVLVCDPYTICASLNYDELLHTHIAWPDSKPSPRIRPKVDKNPGKVDTRYFGFYAVHKFAGLTRCIATRSTESSMTEKHADLPLGGVDDSDLRIVQPLKKSAADYTFRCRRKDMLDQIMSIQKELSCIPQEQSDSIQEYALPLGDGVSRASRVHSIFTLADFTDHLPAKISDTHDFNDMMRQLFGFCDALKVNLNYESIRFLFGLDPGETPDFFVLIEKELEKIKLSFPEGALLNDLNNFGVTAVSLGMSLISGTAEGATENLESNFQSTLKGSKKRVREILDEWDDSSDLIPSMQKTTGPPVTTCMPSIKVVDPLKLSLHTSSRNRRRNDAGTHSQLSYTSQPLQDAPSSKQMDAQLQSTQVSSQADSTVGMLLLSNHSLSHTRSSSQKRGPSQLSQGSSSQKKKPKRKGGFA